MTTVSNGNDSVLACLLAFMRLHGYRGSLATLFGLAPFSPAGAPALAAGARRLGLLVTPWVAPTPLLPGAALLVIAGDGNAALHSDGVPAITPSGEAQAYQVRRHPARPFPRPRLRQSRCWLIPSELSYRATLQRDALAHTARAYDHCAIEERTPIPLQALTVEALLASHRSMAPTHPEFFGCFRAIDMGQHAIFVNAAAIPAALGELFRGIDGVDAVPAGRVLHFTAAVLTDFLTIHPFVNGNRRMGMTLADALLARHGMVPDWRRLPLTELYYGIRCASRGHFMPLVAALQRITRANP